MEGWIKCYRKIIDWEWYQDSYTFHLFIHLILSANYKKTKWRGIEIERGQLLTGRDQLSADTGISTQSIRTALQRLKSTNEITIKSTSSFSIITICNYEKYQEDEKQINQQSNQQSNQQLTSNQPATNHIQEGKEYKEGKKKDITSSLQDSFNIFYQAYPRKVGKEAALKAWKKLNPNEFLLQTILQAIEIAKQSEAWNKDRQFIPHPATWLNGKRWEDEEKIDGPVNANPDKPEPVSKETILTFPKYTDTIMNWEDHCIQAGKEHIVATILNNTDLYTQEKSLRTSEQWENFILELKPTAKILKTKEEDDVPF